MDALESEDSLDSHAFMELAMQELKFALQRLEVPVGCVIVKKGKVIASGSNLTNETRNARRHAEMEAVDGLLQLWQEDGLLQFDAIIRLSECVLCVTCEPCMMCAAALSFLGWKEEPLPSPTIKGSIIAIVAISGLLNAVSDWLIEAVVLGLDD
ncbi:hypothetical protein Cgig2_026425 [Carnegiea gigantea]|uniref:CMP/dCMP-type deaminase domain-containing protein n=1 Tax=Carnegiea gigantea TaxID=171969 RepID=A0A9Q1GPH8_9CARY|nr:hypothetical protein Cgig2_026425 [Carnegiea gigantea]